MKKILPFCIIFLIVPIHSYSDETKTFQGYKIEKPNEYYGYILSVHCGPYLSESDFKKLGLHEEFYSAYYRVVFRSAEINTAAAVELIGLYGESACEVLSAYTYSEFLDPFQKFIGWKSPYDFSFLSGRGNISVTIQEKGKYIVNIKAQQKTKQKIKP